MTTSNPIAVRGVSSVQVEIAAEAYARRKEVLDTAGFAPKAITCADTRQEVADALAAVNRLLKEVESGRKEVKAPVLDLGRKIDATAEEFTAPLAVAQRALQTVLTKDAEEQARIARESEEQRQAELKRQQDEADAKQAELDRQARQAEQVKAEAERKAREATDTESRAKAQQEAKEASDKVSAVDAQKEKEAAQAKLQQAELIRQPVAPAKASGTTVRTSWTFDVVDVHELLKARPELVELTVRRADVLALIRTGIREIPGLNIRQETVANAR